MKETKFRAKRIDMDRWIYGQYFTTPLTDENSGTTPDKGWFFLTGEPRHCIVQNMVAFVIDLNTLGQYTGLKDKSGKEIYEGDIVKNLGYHELCIVEYHHSQYIGRYRPQTPQYKHLEQNVRDKDLCYIGLGFYVCERNAIEVIGNIYENAALLAEVNP